jgi:S-adenosylmethionine-diacylgycerolhomoserine-N-methlytransferase
MAKHQAGGGGDTARHMDGIYRSQRHIYDLTRKYYLLGRDRLLDELRPPKGGSVLEVGCGTARNLILSARRYPKARHFGFDISREMLDTAQQSVARAGLAAQVQLAQGNAAAFSGQELFGVAQFDRVFISYAVSMIPPWREALSAAMAAVAPGGSLHIVDFGQQERLPGWFHTGLQAWLAKFSVEPRADLEAELQNVAAAHGADLQFTRLYRDYAQLAVLQKPKA